MSFPMMHYLSYLDIKHGILWGGGGGKIDPPSVSWFSSTPAGIGLILFLEVLGSDWLNLNASLDIK